MSNRDHRDTSKDLVTDETATPDIGGAFGGSAGTLESREEREDYGEQSGLGGTLDRARALSRPPAHVQGGPSEPLTYGADAGTGMQGAPVPPAPMSQTDARDTATATTDVRRQAGDEGREMGGNYVPDSHADRAAEGANLPERGSSLDNDAF